MIGDSESAITSRMLWPLHGTCRIPPALIVVADFSVDSETAIIAGRWGERLGNGGNLQLHPGGSGRFLHFGFCYDGNFFR